MTTRYAGAAGNFGLAAHPPHEDRYARAEEFVEVVSRLWESWGADAVRNDQDRGIWADTDLIRPVDFHGRFFDVSGALTLPRSPQGRPAFAQAGSSGPGIELAGKTADLVFTAQPDVPIRAAFPRFGPRRARAAATGATRTPSSCCPAWPSCSAAPKPRPGRPGPRWKTRSTRSSAGATSRTTPGSTPRLIDPDRPLTAAAIAAAQPHQPRPTRSWRASARDREDLPPARRELTGLPGGLDFTGTPEQFARPHRALGQPPGPATGSRCSRPRCPARSRVHRPRCPAPANAGCTAPSTPPPPCAATCGGQPELAAGPWRRTRRGRWRDRGGPVNPASGRRVLHLVCFRDRPPQRDGRHRR